MSGFGFVSDVALTDGVVGRRVAAWCVDALLIGIAMGLLHMMLWVLGFLTFGLGWFLVGGLWVVPLAYVVAFVASPQQATPGQALLGLRVVCDDDLGRPDTAQAGIYAVLYAATMWVGGLPLIAAFFTRRARCLHDIASGLLVARADAVGAAASPAWSRPGDTMAGDTMSSGRSRP